MTGSGGLHHRTSIYFKFASEGNVVERIEFYGREIAVGDLRQAIAEKKNLPKFDLVLWNEATDEVYEKDGKMLPKNMIVTVRRNPLHNSKKPAVLHVEDTDVWNRLQEGGKLKQAEDKPAIRRRACPPEYLCSLGNDIFQDPHIARCCGRSACTSCFPRRAPDGSGGGDRCPLCGSRAWGEEGTAPLPNPRLADTVAALDLQYFILPKETRKEVSVCKLEDTKNADEVSVCKLEDAKNANVNGKPATALVVEAAVCPVAPGQPLAAKQHGQARPAAPQLLPPQLGVPMLRPCMMSPDQFLAWQQSLRAGGSGSDSSSDSGTRKRRRGKDRSKKHSKGED